VTEGYQITYDCINAWNSARSVTCYTLQQCCYKVSQSYLFTKSLLMTRSPPVLLFTKFHS